MIVTNLLRTQYAGDLTALVYPGEVVTLDLQLQAPGESGPYGDEELEGRSFVQRIFNPDGGDVLAQALGEIVQEESARYVRFVLPATTVRGLLPADTEAVDLCHVVYEVVGGGLARVFDPQKFVVRLQDDPDAALPVTATPAEDGPSTRFLLQRSPTAERIVMVPTGARGRSAKQSVIDAGALPAGSTDQDFTDWLISAPADAVAAVIRGGVAADRDTLAKISAALDGALTSEAQARDQAIGAAIDAEALARNQAIGTAVDAEELARDQAIDAAKTELKGGVGASRDTLKEISDDLDAGNVSFAAEGADTVRLLRRRFADAYSPFEFGCPEDLVNGDKATILTAINAAAAKCDLEDKYLVGFGRKFPINGIGAALPRKVRDIEIDTSAVAATRSLLTGFTNQIIGAAIIATDLWDPAYPTISLPNGASRGQQLIDVGSTVGLATGSVLELWENVQWGASNTCNMSEPIMVKDVVDGDTIRLVAPIEGNYSAAANLRKYPDQVCHLDDVLITAGSVANSYGLLVSGFKRSHGAVEVREADKVCFAYFNNAQGDFTRIACYGAPNSGFGYGLQYSGSSDLDVQNLYGERMRHVPTAGGGPGGKQMARRVSFGTVHGVGCLDAIADAHPGVDRLHYGLIKGTVDGDSGSLGDGFMHQGGILSIGVVDVTGFKGSAARIDSYGHGDGIDLTYDIGVIRGSSEDTEAAYTLSYQDDSAGGYAGTVERIKVGTVEGRSQKGSRIYATTQLVRNVDIGGKCEAINAGAFEGLLLRHATPGRIERALVHGAHLKGAAGSTGRALYVLGDASNTIKVTLRDSTVEGGNYGIQASYGDVQLDNVDFSGQGTAQVNRAVGGTIRSVRPTANANALNAAITVGSGTSAITGPVHRETDTAVLTADRAVTLPATAQAGDRVIWDRTGGTGNFYRTFAGLQNLGPGQVMEFVYDGAAWKVDRRPSAFIETSAADAAITLLARGPHHTLMLTGALTAARAATLANGQVTGDRLLVIRTGTGAFAWDIGGVVSLAAAGDSAELIWTGAAWALDWKFNATNTGWGAPIFTATLGAPAATIDVTGLAPYRELLVLGRGLQHTDGGNQVPLIRTSTDNGVSFATVGTDYDVYGVSGQQSGYLLGATQPNTAKCGFDCEIREFNVAATATLFGSKLGRNDGTAGAVVRTGNRTVAELNNALRIMFGAGNLNTGTIIQVFGRK